MFIDSLQGGRAKKVNIQYAIMLDPAPDNDASHCQYQIIETSTNNEIVIMRVTESRNQKKEN